jgi:octaprenyl-diphosphate synthase
MRMTPVLVGLQDLYAPVRDDLVQAQRIFDDELTSEFPFLNDLCDTVRSYRGKMLRPALLLLSARATGESSPRPCNPGRLHHTLAAVVEMVHMATLVHDDVLDEADERRKQPTIASADGNVAAVLLGDYLISHAFHLCSSLDSQHASRRIGATTNIVCEGELVQNRRRGDATLSEADYFEIIRRKTGTLTAVACELGAQFAGADEATVAAMHSYGLSAGVAFQIMDDVLDIVGDPGTVGKTLARDLAGGKTTLPMIHCLRHARPATAEALRSAIVRPNPEADDRLSDWLAETASVEYAVSTAREQVAMALQQLDLLPPSDARQSLVALAEFIIDRRF